MRITSWNVNGLRAVWGRDDLAWAFHECDVICLQETKLQDGQLTDAIRNVPGFVSFWSHHKVKRGYSGTAVYVRASLNPKAFSFAIGGDARTDFDSEGRICGVEIGDVVIFSVYFPNGGSSPERLAFKHAWHDAFSDAVTALHSAGKHVVVAGDYNVAHKDIDLALPKEWAGVSGCLPVERAWLDDLLARGFIDTFRADKGDLPRQFTFWETRVDARSINQGWRIDYICISRSLEDRLEAAWISPQVMGSDHCPVGVTLLSDVDNNLDSDVEEEEEEDGAQRWRR